MAFGVIYILINPAFKDLLKIGKTTRTAEERAIEISNGTGVPSKFVVAYEDSVADCDLAERRVFKALEKYRYGTNREFFALKLKEAIPVVMQTVSQVNAEVEGRRVEEQLRVEQQIKSEAVARASEIEARTKAEEQKESEERAEAEAQERIVQLEERLRAEEQERAEKQLEAEAQLSIRGAEAEKQRRTGERLKAKAQTSIERKTKDEKEIEIGLDEDDDIPSGFLTLPLPISERFGKAGWWMIWKTYFRYENKPWLSIGEAYVVYDKYVSLDGKTFYLKDIDFLQVRFVKTVERVGFLGKPQKKTYYFLDISKKSKEEEAAYLRSLDKYLVMELFKVLTAES